MPQTSAASQSLSGPGGRREGGPRRSTVSLSSPLPGTQCPGFDALHLWKLSPGRPGEGEGPVRAFGAFLQVEGGVGRTLEIKAELVEATERDLWAEWGVALGGGGGRGVRLPWLFA